MKSNLEDLYLNIKQCILILLKKYTIWSHNLVLLLLKKRTLFSKIPAVSVHGSKRVSCCSQLWKRLYSRHVYESIFSTPTLLLERTFLRIDVADERTLGRDNCFHSREQAQAAPRCTAGCRRAKRPRTKAVAKQPATAAFFLLSSETST